jgi:hypothetical protein
MGTLSNRSFFERPAQYSGHILWSRQAELDPEQPIDFSRLSDASGRIAA